MGAGDTMSLGSDTLTWDAVVQELHVSSVEHDKVSFAVDWPYFMQVPYAGRDSAKGRASFYPMTCAVSHMSTHTQHTE